MAGLSFINFYKTLENALSKRTSPHVSFYEHAGIQLLPNNINPYRQSTAHPDGIELEDWTVYVVDTCTGNETDITTSFLVDDTFNDDNGFPQFEWSLTNIPLDTGYSEVYLRAEQTLGETFYTNLFQLTEQDSDKTTRIDYKDDEEDTMLSIGLQMYFWQEQKKKEIDTYYETSTKNTVINVIKSQRFERWVFESVSNDLFLKFSDILEYKWNYFNLIRGNSFEADEIPDFEAEEDFYENIILLTFNKSDIFNPLYVAPVVVEPTPFINLSSVLTNGVNAIYTFTYGDFAPQFLTYQTSQDQVTWNSTNDVITSPNSISFNGTGIWYFRIIHQEAQSNVIQLDLGATVIAVNDNISVDKGEVIDISVLFNDTLVGDTVITAVSTASAGTTAIIDSDTKIRYTHDDSATLTDSFTYTISNGITSDTATVNVSVIQESTVFETDKLGYDESTGACSSWNPANIENMWHDGTGALPAIGDTIYEDSSMIPFYIFDGNDFYYPILNGTKTIQISSYGIVTDVQLC